MTDRRLPLGDADLEAALRNLGGLLAVPGTAVAGPDPARRARLRIEQGARGPARARRWSWLTPNGGRRVGRGVALALVAVVALAAVAGAIGLGLPGIRIVPAPTSTAVASGPAASGPATPRPTASPRTGPSPSPTVASPLGSNLGLGDPTSTGALDGAVDFPVAIPARPGLGSPMTAWIRDARLSLVWAATATLPATAEPGVGLVLTQFRGSLEAGYFEKLVGQGTTVETVVVGAGVGYWISGAPHEIVYIGPSGDPVFDSRRSVGDTLLWARGDVTYRLETSLGRAATIAVAESMP
ncbi:MAG: hypothetical protein ABIZ72_02235 [Candidatus Limnocylindrales bacterium]